MKIRVRLFHTLARYTPGPGDMTDPGDRGFFELEVPPGTTVGGLLGRLGVPEGLTSLAFVDGRQETLDSVLPEGAEVMLIPPVPGG